MNKILSTDGRINRGSFFGFSLLLNIMAALLILALPSPLEFAAIFGVLFLIGIIYESVCLTVQRFHDLGRSGLDYFLLIIPFYNIYIYALLLFEEGENEANKYGPNPLLKID